MQYVAMLRALRVLKWYGLVLAAIEVLVFVAIYRNGPPNVGWRFTGGDTESRIPLDVLMLGALFGPLVVSSFLAAGLDGEYKTVAIAWTRPISRLSIAARYLVVDAAALFAAWLMTLVAVLIPIVVTGLAKFLMFTVLADARAFALGAGTAVMWYGLVILTAALLPGRGGAIAGWSWGIFLILPGLAQAPFPSVIHDLFLALNFADPLAYLGNVGSDRSNVLHLDTSVRVALLWTIGVAAVVAGTQLWAKREVPA